MEFIKNILADNSSRLIATIVIVTILYLLRSIINNFNGLNPRFIGRPDRCQSFPVGFVETIAETPLGVATT